MTVYFPGMIVVAPLAFGAEVYEETYHGGSSDLLAVCRITEPTTGLFVEARYYRANAVRAGSLCAAVADWRQRRADAVGRLNAMVNIVAAKN